MALARVFPNASGNVVYGGSVIQPVDVPGDSTYFYAPANRTIQLPDPSGTAFFKDIGSRYLYHGGAGGSGNWEH